MVAEIRDFADEFSHLRVALVHDWLVSYRGGERTLEALLELFPAASVFTLFFSPHQLPVSLARCSVQQQALLPAYLFRHKAFLLPYLPSWVESWDLSGYDLVISSSSCVAKGVVPPPGIPHVCYLHSPMRYVWDQAAFYQPRWRPLRYFYHVVASRLRLWDSVSAQRPTILLANSHFVAQRVRSFYGRSAEVLWPPVEVASRRCRTTCWSQGAFDLAVGQQVAYKRFDLAVEAAALMKRKLIMVGRGPEHERLRRLADPRWVEFRTSCSDTQLQELYASARAVLFPGVEDFGMVPIEALAHGTPIVAYSRGGALDTTITGQTGALFSTPTAAALAEACQQLNPQQLVSHEMSQFAQRFSKTAFQHGFASILRRVTAGQLIAAERHGYPS